MKNYIRIILLGFLFLVSQGVYANQVNQTLHVSKKSASFQVYLDANPSTGFQWIVKGYDKNVLILGGHHFSAPKTKLIGASGVDVWVFKLNPAGIKGVTGTTIRFVYARPWNMETARKATIRIIFQ